MQDTVLKKAYILYRKRQFAQAISVLESQIFKFRKHEYYYQLLGSACARVSDYPGAISYFTRAIDLNPQSSYSLLSLAILHALKEEEKKSLEYALKVQEIDPQNKSAKAIIEHLRKSMPSLDHKKLSKFLPRFPHSAFFIPRIVIISTAILLLATVVFFVILAFSEPKAPRNQAALLSPPSVLITETPNLTEQVLTEKEIRNSLARIRTYFLSYRDNMVRREANFLLSSNASEELLHNIRSILASLPVMDFENIADSAGYEELVSDPPRYHETYVRWSGKIANLLLADDRIQFEFLIGYHNSKILEGIVAVSVPFSVLLENGDSIELVGQVDTTQYPYHLTATAIRRILAPQ